MTTKILNTEHTKAMVKALGATPGMAIARSSTGFVVRFKGHEVFRALKGNRAIYLVRYVQGLFDNPQAIITA